MIISRTPLRISFFGGGTDYPVWYKEHGGAVIATTINKYNYIFCRYLPPFFNYKFRIRYRLTEETQKIDEIKHPSVRECLKFFDIQQGVEIQHNSDLPGMSGLGSSSSFTVGLIHALTALKGKMTTKRHLALDAIHIEQDLIGEHVGSQDQTVSAFGGLNLIRFGGEQSVSVSPMTIGKEKVERLNSSFMLFFTGLERMASNIAKEQIRETPNKYNELNQMSQLVEEALKVFNGRIDRMDDVGKLLHESWKIKRSLTNKISNGVIDEIYDTAIANGAEGGKLLGAGGGGFLLFFVKPENQAKLREKLKSLLYVPFSLENLGSQIIYYAPYAGV